MSNDDKAIVKQLYNAFDNAKIFKFTEVNDDSIIYLTTNDDATVRINNNFFKDILPNRYYYLEDLYKQINQ